MERVRRRVQKGTCTDHYKNPSFHTGDFDIVKSSRKLTTKSSKDKNSNLHKAQASNISSMSVKVDSPAFKGASCVLYSDLEGGKVGHVIHKCLKFPTPQAKVEKLKSLNGCTRCASLSHLTNKCAFRFKRKCVKCSGWHFSYLCSKSTTQKSTNSQENNSSIVLSSFGNDTMLPTFSLCYR